MIRLSDFVIKFLEDKGVSHIFMLPGGGAIHLDDSLGRSKKIKYTCFLHEQALAIAVEAYSQHKNFPGVGLVTSGPGGTNTVTAVAAAYIDSTPCFFISGQAKSSDLKGSSGVRQMGSQEVDIVSIISPITKYAVTILEPIEIKYHLEKAWYYATEGRMGPVWIDIPLDIQGSMIDEKKLHGYLPQKTYFDFNKITTDIDYIINMLNLSKRPLILIGNGVKLSEGQNELYKFIETNSIPVLTTWKTIDMFDYDHPLNFGSPGLMGSRAANFIVQNCDLLLILGSRLDTSITAFNSANFARNAKKIMIDIDEAEIRKIENIHLSVVSDVKVILSGLNNKQQLISKSDYTDWISYCNCMKNNYPVVIKEYKNNSTGVNLYLFIDQLFEQLTEKDIICPESSGAAGEVTYQAMKVKFGQKIKNAAGLGSMGFGLPYAIGSCIANDRKRTILINGDGALQLNLQELQTLKALNLPIKMFIFDNNGYGSIRLTQDNMFGGPHVGSDTESGLSLPNLHSIAKAYGIRTETINDHRNLVDDIDRALRHNDPVLCIVKETPEHLTAPRVKAKKLPNGNMTSDDLENMWPYLSRQEIESNMRWS